MSKSRRFVLSAAAAMVATLTLGIQGRATGYNAYSVLFAGSAPHFVAVGDFNNDGIPDIVSANYGSNTVSILLGVGNGTFGSAINSTAGSYPISVAVGDFNGDGKLDVAVANNGNNLPGGNLAILIGNGDGTLQAPVNYATQGSPFYVAVADLNGDGLLDVVVASHGAPVQVFLNTGGGNLGTSKLYNAGGNPQSVIRAARLGFGLALAIIGGPPARFAPYSELFRRALDHLRALAHHASTVPRRCREPGAAEPA